jgi:hypothetical protein
MSFVGRVWSEKVLPFVLARGPLLWAIALLLALPAALRTGSLYAHLKADVAALLPANAPSVQAKKALFARATGLTYLGVVVEVPPANGPADPAMGDALAFLDRVAEKVGAFPADEVARVRRGTDEEQAFLEKNAPLYLDVDELIQLRDAIAEQRDYAVRKSTGADLSDDSDAPPTFDTSKIEAKYKARIPPKKPGAIGTRFANREQRTALILIEVGPLRSKKGGRAALFHQVKEAVAASGLPGGARVGYTGDVAIEVEETEALLADLSLSTLVVLALVTLVLRLYFKVWKPVLALFPPLLVATVLAFAVASLPPFGVTELNSNTAFLGSIVIGNGINFAILFLARYVEVRRRLDATASGSTDNLDAALREAFLATPAGTGTAAAAAGIAYAALAVTDFQGFRQFGFIGGLGMLFSWLSAYFLLPSLLRRFDGDDAPYRSGVTRTAFSPFAALGRLVVGAPRALVALGVAATIAAGFSVAHHREGAIEANFSKLRRRDTWQTGEGYWGRRMDALLGRYLTPLAILAEDAPSRDRIAAAVRASGGLATGGGATPLVAEVRTSEDVLPSKQTEKIVVIEEIKDSLTPKVLASLPEDKRIFLQKFFPSNDDAAAPLQPFGADALPTTFVAGLREHDGRIDRTVLVYPIPSQALWKGPTITAFVGSLRTAAAVGLPEDPHSVARVAGSLPVSADILAALQKDGPRATLLAFLGVFVVTLLLFGRRGRVAGLVLGVLLFSLLQLAGLVLGLGMKVNFANFIAFPITFGIGVDYPANVLARWVTPAGPATARGRLEEAIVHAGSAVALCSATTIIGYGSLLLAQNQALFLFGVIAVLGEICCLMGALLFAPAVVAWATLGASDRRQPAPAS